MKTIASDAELQSLLARLRKLTPDSPRRWGKMTSHQMICHLNDAFLVVFGERKASPATGVLQQTVMKWGALYFPIPWPRGVPTRPEMDQHDGGTPPTAWENDSAQLAATMRRFAAASHFDDDFHAFFGTLTMAQWKRWGFLHADHHLRQFGV